VDCLASALSSTTSIAGREALRDDRPAFLSFSATSNQAVEGEGASGAPPAFHPDQASHDRRDAADRVSEPVPPYFRVVDPSA
jgi:hypothetical protein